MRLRAVLAVAVLLRVVPWLLPHTFLGVQESDDGVYYASARLLLDGQVPYRDVTIVHPPGIAVLLAPFAAVGALLGDSVGMALARLAMVGVAVLNTVLVHRLAQRVPGVNPLLAAAVYAVMPNAVVAEHTVLLEPVVSLLCLTALLVLPRRPFLAGVLCAAGVAVKLFAGAYVLVLLAWLLWQRRDALIAYAAGLLAGTALLVGPLLAAAPHAFVTDVVRTQLERPADAADHGLARVTDLLGLHWTSPVIGTALLVALLVALARQGRPAPERVLWLGVLGVGAVAFATSPSYFPHYAAFLAPALGIVLAGVARPLGAAFLVGMVLTTTFDLARDSRPQDDWHAAGERIPDGACVWSELASYPIAAGVFRPPTSDCPGWVDGRGVAYTRAGDWPKDRSFYPAGFRADQGWQAETREQMSHADWLLLGAEVPELDDTTWAYVRTHFTRVQVLHGPKHAAGEVWRRGDTPH